MNVLVLPYGEIVFKPDGVEARTAWGVFPVPADVYARAARLNYRYPDNYEGGYLNAWCRNQQERHR